MDHVELKGTHECSRTWYRAARAAAAERRCITLYIWMCHVKENLVIFEIVGKKNHTRTHARTDTVKSPQSPAWLIQSPLVWRERVRWKKEWEEKHLRTQTYLLLRCFNFPEVFDPCRCWQDSSFARKCCFLFFFSFLALSFPTSNSVCGERLFSSSLWAKMTQRGGWGGVWCLKSDPYFSHCPPVLTVAS